jgi:hypothetical protein
LLESTTVVSGAVLFVALVIGLATTAWELGFGVLGLAVLVATLLHFSVLLLVAATGGATLGRVLLGLCLLRISTKHAVEQRAAYSASESTNNSTKGSTTCCFCCEFADT